jgi:RecA/RadA recombinase
VEIYGPEASGKTTLALHAIAEAQKQGGNTKNSQNIYIYISLCNIVSFDKVLPNL